MLLRSRTCLAKLCNMLKCVQRHACVPLQIVVFVALLAAALYRWSRQEAGCPRTAASGVHASQALRNSSSNRTQPHVNAVHHETGVLWGPKLARRTEQDIFHSPWSASWTNSITLCTAMSSSENITDVIEWLAYHK